MLKTMLHVKPFFLTMCDKIHIWEYCVTSFEADKNNSRCFNNKEFLNLIRKCTNKEDSVNHNQRKFAFYWGSVAPPLPCIILLRATIR